MSMVNQEFEYVLDALKDLQSKLSQRSLSKSVMLPTDTLYAPVKKAIRDLEKHVGLPALPGYIKAAYVNGEYKGMKFPELALVKGKPVIIIDNKSYDAQTLLSAEGLRYQSEGKGETKNTVVTLEVTAGKGETLNEETMYIPFKLYVSPEQDYDTFKLKKSRDYLLKSLFEYVHSCEALVEGTYAVIAWSKAGKFPTMTIDGKLYHCKPKFIEHLESRKAKELPTTFVIGGKYKFTSEDGKEIETRQQYIDGHKPAQAIKALVNEYYELPPTKEALKEIGTIIFKEPVVLHVKGVSQTMVNEKDLSGEMREREVTTVQCLVNGNLEEKNIRANSTINGAYNKGKFNVRTFNEEPFLIKITGVKYHNGYSFIFVYDIPESIISSNNTIDEMFEKINLVAV